MLKKLSVLFIVLALVLQVLPPHSGNDVSAATGSFNFTNESDKSKAPRVTTEPRVTLTGAISNVNASTVSYDVVQIINNKGDEDPTNDQTGSVRENVTSNIYINGFNIQVYNIELFPGLNRVTFRGIQGGGEVSNSIYINYHNSPVFYDLVAQLDGNKFNIEEEGTTVVHSAPSAGKNAADISITGFAPNAQTVTVVTNNSSKTYNVSSSNNYQFAASPINLQKGKNLVTIKVKNADQTIETTREIAFYNGSVTFYDLNLNEDLDTITNSTALEFNSDFTVTNKANVYLTGKVIVPNAQRADVANGPILPHPDPMLPLPITYTTTPYGPTSGVELDSLTPMPSAGNATDEFFVYEFKQPLDSSIMGAPAVDFNIQYGMKLTAVNQKKAAQSVTVKEGTGVMRFTLRDARAQYIEQINYLNGYKNNAAFEGITGTALDGVNLFGIPFAMEVLIANPDTTETAELVKVESVKNISGTNAPSTFLTNDNNVNFKNESASLSSPFVYREINGVTKLYKREIIIFKKLPFEGTQTIELSVGTVKKSAKFTMLFGPFTSYETIVDNMIVNDDTNLTSSIRIANIISDKLSDFKGKMNNVNNIAEIRYDFASNAAQTVFFYINNTPIRLQQVSGGAVTDFQILDTAEERKKAFQALFSGVNEIRFVFQGAKNSYEKKLTLNLIPTNIPVIPVDTALGIFPYSSMYDEPLANDPKFQQKGSIFNTTEATMNVFGTFDFIDLGTTVGEIETVLGNMKTDNDLTKPENYIFKIEGSNLSAPILWDLNKRLYIIDSKKNNEQLAILNPNATGNLDNISVRYDIQSQSFSFIFLNENLNPDGSSSVYNFTVYNNGITGPKASYRLEVDPTSMPFTVVRPLLPAKSVVNQNFLEVVINAPVGAESVIINKMVAEKFEFNSDNDPSTPEETYMNTYRTTVKLKVGKNVIDFIIKRADDEVKSSFTVTYTPTNIPGAQYLETMKNSHKVFEGAVNLKFPSNTSLIRSDFNVPANLKNQVFTGNNLLFAIANPEDGVVDRRELEILPPGFDITLESFGTRFRLSYPTRFTKASPVYWIDAGLADDPNTGGYDPLSTGVDPYQFYGAKGLNNTNIPTYDERPDDRELITSKTGTLTLAYDPNMKDSIGTIITVYRYDVKAKYWENMGGTVDVKKNTVTVPFTKFGYYVVGKMVYSFDDITSHPYGRNFIEAVYAKGIMNAAGYDEFGTDIYISRGEFARMIVKALDIPLNYELSKPHFDDVPTIINPDALWDYRYVETAAREGIIRGKGARTFEPSSNLTREEAAVVIARALDLKLGTDAAKIKKDLDKVFKDGGNVNYYAQSSVVAIAKKGYILGSPVDRNNLKAGYVFEPRSSLLRSDAAIIIARILADLKKLPKIN